MRICRIENTYPGATASLWTGNDFGFAIAVNVTRSNVDATRKARIICREFAQ